MNYLRLFLFSAFAVTVSTSGCIKSERAFTSSISAQNGPQNAIVKLKEGNLRFSSGQAIHPNQDIKRVKEVAPKQKPFAIILSCSDSRVPPEVIFDQGIGDLFVIRIAGQVVDNAALASIEYAVEHLGVDSLVVMGHESCGAVKAAMNTVVGESAGSPSLDLLVAAIRPNIKDFAAVPNDSKIRLPVCANVDAVAKGIVESSHIIQEFVEQRKLYFARALYIIENGSVVFWEEGFPALPEHSPLSSIHSESRPSQEQHRITISDPTLKN